MAAFPSYTIVGLLATDFQDGGAIPGTDTGTAMTAEAVGQIKAILAPYFPAGITITQV